jgi:transcriptional regulator with GAF, ATPase, and Fis domain
VTGAADHPASHAAGPYARGVPETREQLADALVELTTQLVADGTDVGALLRVVTRSCGELTGAAAAGLLMTDARGGLEVVAASDDTTEFLEVLQVLTGDGPCVESIRTGEIVGVADLGAEDPRWPAFAEGAVASGFRAVHAFPLRLRRRAVGGLNLFHAHAGELTREQLQACQALADLAVLGLTAEPGDRRDARLVETTLVVLNERVRLAQAVGMVAAARGLDPGAARVLLHAHADRRRTTATAVAEALTTGRLAPGALAADAPPRPSTSPGAHRALDG